MSLPPGILSIEGYPFIIRFKTNPNIPLIVLSLLCIEGYPFIIRFKTSISSTLNTLSLKY